MTKKQRALIVIERLREAYPDADCTLEYEEAWKLLVSVRLAAQCTDARVNQIVPKLYEKYPDIDALAAATAEEIEEIVRPCGLGKSKARDINACMKMLRDEYESKVPEDFDALLRLPGVGRKSANLIMGDVFGKPAIVTDTHCIRLVNRIGLVDGIKDQRKLKALWKVIPPEEGSALCHRFVCHGRDVAQREQHRIVNGAVWLMCVRLTQRLIKSLCSRKYKSSFFYNGYFTTVSAIDDNVAQFMIWDRNICVASEISMSAVGVTQ